MLLIVVSLILLSTKCNSYGDNVYFNDPTEFFPKSEKDRMENKLQDLNKTDRYKLFVYLVHSDITNHEGEHRLSVFSAINDSIQNESVLVYLAYADKKVYIVTGKRIKNYLTDSLCSYVISRMTPAFANGEYYNGINIGVDIVDSIITNSRYVTF